MKIEKSEISIIFVEWIDHIKKARGISYSAIYRQIGISKAKGAKIRGDDSYHATIKDLKKLASTYIELLPFAITKGIKVDLSAF